MEHESPAERTDPLLPVVIDERTPPVLDDRRLAGLLAELDADEPSSAVVAGDLAGPRAAADRPGAVGGAGSLPDAGVARRSRLVIDAPALDPAPSSDCSAATGRPGAADNPAATGRPVPADRYVRREYRPEEPPADATGLTGLGSIGESRLGTVLFTAFFLGIFVLILVEVVVSLLRAGS